MARPEPRRKANRALLVGVPEYDYKQPDRPNGVPGDLKAVAHNLTALRDALGRGGVFGEDEIVESQPANVDDFDRQLDAAVDAAEGVLLLYFSGHGAVPSTGAELWFLMRTATIEAGTESVFRGAAPWKSVLTVLGRTGAEHVVVVLDCCYAGNAAAAWDALGAAQRRRTSLLMSVQANNRIDAGNGDTPTPFTARLVHILNEGVGPGGLGRPSAEAGGETGETGFPVGFGKLAEALRAYMSRHEVTLREPPEPWEPQSRSATSGEDVLLALGAAPPPPPPPPIPPPVVPPPLPSWRRVRNALKALGAGLPKPPARTLAVVAAVLVALAGLTAVGLVLFRESSCKPPLELRLLTDPDIEPTVRKAAEDYLTSDANTTDDGCRRSGITVYSAGAADVVAAFRDQSDPWQRPTSDDINPQRDIGPQPDIWIPASSANVARARATTDQRRWAELVADPAAFAYSPIVLAVPQALATEGSGRTSGLGELMAGLKGKAEVRRTDPEYTDAGLLATVGLYGAHGTGNAGAEKAGAAGAAAAERSVAQLGPPSPTGADLLCVLPDDDAVDDRTAALVPEFLMKTGVSCDRTTRARRMAEYPDDVPGLDPTFVRVRWDDADRDTSARSAEVERFHDWLTGAGAGGKDGADAAQGGLAEFGKDGFRSASGDHPPLGSGFAFSDFGALSAPGRLTDSVHQDAMSATLTDYRDAHGPGRVLFLLDSSGSMGDLWEGPGGAPGIVKQSLGGLGTQDEYGVWAVASEAGAKRPYSELLAFGQYGRGVAERAIDRTARVRNAEADPYGALIAALNTMAQRGVDDDRPQLIVYLTDDEDNNRLTEGGRLDNLLRSAQSRMVPVVMASLDSGGCDEGKADAAISEASGGRCLDTRTDLVAALRDEVARTGTGEE